MQLMLLAPAFSVCKAHDPSEIDLTREFCFVGKTDRELSVVCETAFAPPHALAREDGWRGFRIEGTLDFSLTGILARIASLLAQQEIPVFAVSTYDTDYLFVKQEKLPGAVRALKRNGYSFQTADSSEKTAPSFTF